MAEFIIETVSEPKMYRAWGGGVMGWTMARDQAHMFSQQERDHRTLPQGGCWVLISESTLKSALSNAEGMKKLLEFFRPARGVGYRAELVQFLESHVENPEQAAAEILDNLEILADGGSMPGGY